MKTWKLQLVLGMLLAGSLVLALSVVVLAADSYPNKPIRLIVPFAPGAGTDAVGRITAQKLGERLSQQVVVENHGGSGGVLGTEIVARAKPDGYTLLLASTAYAFSASLYRKLPYDTEKSFIPVVRMVIGPIALAVNLNLPVKSIKELIALAKEKPGQLIVASSGIGGFAHLGGVLFTSMTGIDLKTVQFKGGSATQTDVIGGHSQIVFNGTASLVPYIKSGQLRGLGVGSLQRSVLLPELPMIAETIPGYEAVNVFGIFAPAGTPQAIVDRLSTEVLAFVAQPEVQKQYLAQGVEAAPMGPAEYDKFVKNEITKWGKVIKEAGIEQQ